MANSLRGMLQKSDPCALRVSVDALRVNPAFNNTRRVRDFAPRVRDNITVLPSK